MCHFLSRIIRGLLVLVCRWLDAPVGVVMPVVGLVFVLAAPQMPSMFAAIGYGTAADGQLTTEWWRQLGFGAAAVALGLFGWYWSRAALLGGIGIGDYNRPDPRQPGANVPPNWWSYEWAPRAALLSTFGLAVSPVGLAAVGELQLGTPQWHSVLASLALLVLAFLLVVFRRRLRLVRGMGAPTWAFDHRVTALFAGAPFGWGFALGVFALSFLGAWVIAARPWWIDDSMHTPTAALLAMGLVIGPLTLALEITRDLAALAILVVRRPCAGSWAPPNWLQAVSSPIGIAVLLVYASALTVGDDNPQWYSVRTAEALADPADCAKPAPATARPCLGQALRDWVNVHRQGLAPDHRLPLVIVAAEGGASRAAAWTLSSLRMLDAHTGGAVGRDLFAITSVSGGSLGAVTYLEALKAYPAAGGGIAWSPPPVLGGLREIARGDLLAASIGAFFCNDILAHLFRALWHAPDRGTELEDAFERHWQLPYGFALKAEQTRLGLVALWHQLPAGAPHVILNGTDRSTGQRLLTSTIRFAGDEDVFPGSRDLLSIIGCDVPASAAVLTSARFPYISPAGRYRPCRAGQQPAAPLGQVLDGGYFENYGARTALDLAAAIRREAAAFNLPVEPVVIAISDDADAYDHVKPGKSGEQTLESVTVSCVGAASDGNVAGQQMDASLRAAEAVTVSTELMSPIVAVAALRSAHNQDALQLLRRATCGDRAGLHFEADGTLSGDAIARARSNARMFAIALPEPEHADEDAPMNWVLDPNACRFMLTDAPFTNYNAVQADLLGRALAYISGTAVAAPAQLAAIDCGGS